MVTSGVAVVLMLTSVFPKPESIDADTSVDLNAMSTMSRLGGPALSSLPGSGPWKELALAAIEANNRCEVGGPKPTPRFTAALANLRMQDVQMLASKVKQEAKK